MTQFKFSISDPEPVGPPLVKPAFFNSGTVGPIFVKKINKTNQQTKTKNKNKMNDSPLKMQAQCGKWDTGKNKGKARKTIRSFYNSILSNRVLSSPGKIEPHYTGTCSSFSAFRSELQHSPYTMLDETLLLRCMSFPFSHAHKPGDPTYKIFSSPRSTCKRHPIYCCLDALPDPLRMRERKHYKVTRNGETK